MAKQLDKSICAICAHDIKSSRCPHPWSKPFEQWTKLQLKELREHIGT